MLTNIVEGETELIFEVRNIKTKKLKTHVYNSSIFLFDYKYGYLPI